ncbi:serine threonine kinase 16 [Fusarium albosuccineum]|uniref:Serine threonine kinase 16 n=1 Tax=Fusarium albosuccineum TaxID=1237068 RepID=A0A8H4P8W9_9HYPO|nr:serine threonine kinase 16 [Fusarium albosuccineum]
MLSASADVDTGSTVPWPPGTVLLEDPNRSSSHKGVILQPRPTQDPNDPLNWSKGRKYLNFLIVCIYSVMVSEFTSSATPTWGPMQKELSFSDAQLNNSYAIGCAFLGIGAVLLIPFALKFGRRPLYLISTILQCLIAVWSAKQTTYTELMLINAFQCGVGSLAEVMVQMTIADVFFIHQRGRLNSVYVWLWKLASPLGSLIAGYVALDRGWRWVWWGNAIFIGAFAFVVAFLYEETKFCPRPAPSVSTNTAHTRSAPTTMPDSKDDKILEEKGPKALESVGAADRLFNNYTLQLHPVMEEDPSFATSCVYGILVALNDVISTTISTYMKKPPYDFNSGQVGLMSLPKIIGVTIGCLIGGPLTDWSAMFLSRRNKGLYEPEVRLWCFCIFVPLVPAGAILTGVGLNNGLSWPLVALGVVLYNVGVAPIASVALTYLGDSHGDIIGDALVGVTVVRNAFSTAFIFALTPWIDRIGITYVFVTLLLISVFILAFFIVFLKWGKTFRAQCAARYQYYAARQYRKASRH